MVRRKKRSLGGRCLDFIRSHRRLSLLGLAGFLILCYFPIHAYHVYADHKKITQARAAIDTAYSAISRRLGRPDDLKTLNSCAYESGLLGNHITCTVETDFIYGAANTNQANIYIKQIQTAVKDTKLFKPAGKLAAGLSDNLVFDTYYHDALDHWRGPHHIACTIKYSFDTPDEVDLSLHTAGLAPFEVFFACSASSVRAIYPGA